MNCQDFENKISGFIDGELPENEMKSFREHLASCEHCSQLLSELQSVDKMLVGMEELLPDEAYWAGFDARLKDKIEETAEKRPWWNFYPLIRRHLGWALIAVVVVMIAVMPILRETLFSTKIQPATEKISAPVKQGAEMEKKHAEPAEESESKTEKNLPEASVTDKNIKFKKESAKDLAETTSGIEETTSKADAKGISSEKPGRDLPAMEAPIAAEPVTAVPSVTKPVERDSYDGMIADDKPALAKPGAIPADKITAPPPAPPVETLSQPRGKIENKKSVDIRMSSPVKTEITGSARDRKMAYHKAAPPKKPVSTLAKKSEKAGEEIKNNLYGGRVKESSGRKMEAKPVQPSSPPKGAVFPDKDAGISLESKEPVIDNEGASVTRGEDESGSPPPGGIEAESLPEEDKAPEPHRVSAPTGAKTKARKMASKTPPSKPLGKPQMDPDLGACIAVADGFKEKSVVRRSSSEVNTYLATSEVVLLKVVAMAENKVNLESLREELTLANYVSELDRNAGKFLRDPVLKDHSRAMQVITNDIMTIKPNQLPSLKRKIINSGIIDKTRELKR